MKKVIFFTVFFLMIIGGAGFVLWQKLNAPYVSEDTVIIVKPGSSLGTISDLLVDKELIESALLFKIYAKIQRKASSLKAGEFLISEGASVLAILDVLSEGRSIQHHITIQEGLTNYQIAQRLAAVFPEESVSAVAYAEGSLLPDTYAYTYGDSAEDVLERMHNALKTFMNEAWKNRAADLPIKTKEEALILASIVEKETALDEERRDVAGVFINRLRMGMKLQSDPTVIYALTGGMIQENGNGPLGRRLLKKDLSYDSPFNTYAYKGLPPAPIANPGRASIEVVLNPAEHGYYYFVADGTGGHGFSKTLAEHNKKVRVWRKIRRSMEN